MHTITTLGHLISERYGITAHCGVCQHSRALDLSGLADRLGPGFVAIGDPQPLAAVLRCDKCRSKAIGLIIAPPSTPTPGLGLYGSQKG